MKLLESSKAISKKTARNKITILVPLDAEFHKLFIGVWLVFQQ